MHILLFLPFLEHNKRVFFYVGHVYLFALFNDVRMFAYHQPSHVGKEKSSRRVVRVAVLVAVLVMLSMVPNPDVQTVLEVNN